MAKKSKVTVDQFMAELEHPFKAEVEVVRDIIKGVNPGIGEQVKWKAPSYYYNGADFVTFNLWTKQRVHLIFHHVAIAGIESALLEGDYIDRRMLYLADMNDISAKKPELERIVRELIAVLGTS